MTLLLGLLCTVLIATLVVSVRYNIRHGKIIIDVEDAVEEALDVCDQSHNAVVRVLELPVAMATPEVRQVLREIERVRDAILYVSNALAGPYGGVVEEEVDDTKGKEKEV